MCMNVNTKCSMSWKGMIDVYVGDECFRAAAGECAFLPKRKAHAFKIQSSEVHMLVLMTPGGFMNASATMAIPAQSLVIPPDDGISYATVNLDETIKVFEKYGVAFLLLTRLHSSFLLFLCAQAISSFKNN